MYPQVLILYLGTYLISINKIQIKTNNVRENNTTNNAKHCLTQTKHQYNIMHRHQ